MNRSSSLFCSALIAAALIFSAGADTAGAAPAAGAAEPAFPAAECAESAEIIIDLSELYKDKFRDNLDAAMQGGGLVQSAMEESAKVWTEDQMPEAISYSLDGGAWSAPIKRRGHRFIIKNQPLGRHGYSLRCDFVTGKGRCYAYSYIKPTLHEGPNNCLAVSKRSMAAWKWSKKVTFKLDDRLLANNQLYASGKATACIDGGETYTVDRNGCFTADLPFEEAGELRITYSMKPQYGPLNICLPNFANTPQGADTVVVSADCAAD